MANTDTATFNCHAGSAIVNVVSNDTDPEGNYPLNVTAANGDAAGYVSAQVYSSTSVQLFVSDPGTYVLSYVVADSLGASSTGQINLTVTGNCS